MNNEKVDVLVIGAGLSGLIFAAVAQSAGKKVLILEKSKGLGGRSPQEESMRSESIMVCSGLKTILKLNQR